MINWDEINIAIEHIEICGSNSYEPEDEKCLNCLYCRECLYEFEGKYECLLEHFWFKPEEDGVPGKPCLNK